MTVSVLFQQHFQVAYVVRDIEAATQRFAREFGIARWDVMDMAALLGPGHGTRFIGNAYAGEVMIELIEPDPTGESLYRDKSEEHTSELQSLMRNSYAVFCLKKKPEYHTT